MILPSEGLVEWGTQAKLSGARRRSSVGCIVNLPEVFLREDVVTVLWKEVTVLNFGGSLLGG